MPHTADLVERIDKTLCLIEENPETEEYPQELYKILKEIPEHVQMERKGILWLPIPRTAYAGAFGGRFGLTLQKDMLLGNKYSLLDGPSMRIYDLYGFAIGGLLRFDIRQLGGKWEQKLEFSAVYS